jgi:hypothetical protein
VVGLPEAPDANPQITQAIELVERAAREDVQLRLIGGVAVAVHSPTALLLRSDYADIDLVVDRAGAQRLDALIGESGYLPDVRFNSLHGNKRRLYLKQDGRQIDVFVSEFEMCHRLPLGERLDVDYPTLPLAELVLTKAQIVQLNEKDVFDLVALLVDHQVGSGDDDIINLDRIAELCAHDWGLWCTVTGTLERLDNLTDDARRAVVEQRVAAIARAIDDAPKTGRWKRRARIGKRVRWYELPEDPRRNT